MNGEERYAVGLWVNNYPAGHASAELVHIIVQAGPFVRRSCQRLRLQVVQPHKKACISKKRLQNAQKADSSKPTALVHSVLMCSQTTRARLSCLHVAY